MNMYTLYFIVFFFFGSLFFTVFIYVLAYYFFNTTYRLSSHIYHIPETNQIFIKVKYSVKGQCQLNGAGDGNGSGSWSAGMAGYVFHVPGRTLYIRLLHAVE